MFLTNYAVGLREIALAFRQWRIAHMIGYAGIRTRYARSRIGQFWVTLSTFILIMSTGIVWSLLWKLPVQDFLPYLAASHLAWLFITGCINESAGALAAHAPYFINNRASFWTIILSIVYRNGLILLHNLPVYVVVLAVFRIWPGAQVLLFLPGVVLVAAFCGLLGILVSLACLRFRDLIQLVGSIMMIGFFVTPVMWKPEFMPAAAQWVLLVNPFASLVALFTDPLLGRPLHVVNWVITLGWVVVLAVIAPLAAGTWRNRVIYWV